MNERLATMEADIKYIKEFVENDRKSMRKHIDTAQGYRDRVIRLNGVGEDLKGHIISDRRMFFLIITLQAGIFLKLLFL